MDNLFYKYLVEAPGDVANPNDDPPIPDSDSAGMDNGDMGDMGGDDFGGDGMDDMPPDGMEDFDPTGDLDNGAAPDGGDMGGGGMEDFGGDDENQENQNNQNGDNQQQPMKLSDKVSALMNAKLYKEYLELINKIDSQSNTIKENRDIFFTISSDSIDILDKLKKLDENLRSYIEVSFMNEDYSVNLLFFNKCLNLYKFINEDFQSLINKGINQLDI